MPSPTRGRLVTSVWIAAPVFVALVVLAGSPVLAQQSAAANQDQEQSMASADMSKPAPIMVIYKEDVKPGRVPAHDQLEASYARTYSKMPGSRYYLAMNSVTGPNQAWFMQPYSSLEEVAKEAQANEQAPMPVRASLRQIAAGEVENLTDQKAITTVYREDLSFNASMKNVPQSRYCEVVTYRVLPGHDAEFAEAAKLVRTAYEKANIPMQWATYQVFAGAPAGTYYVFRTVDSLDKLDPTNMKMMQAVNTALGEDGEKRLMGLVSNGQISRELNIYAFNPQTSYAPPEFVEADSFWAPQPAQMATAGTSGKGTKTTTGVKTVKKQ
jgi:hypothetical protein